MRKHFNFSFLILSIVVLFVCKSIFAAQYVYISGVPDWDQPVLAAIPPEAASGVASTSLGAKNTGFGNRCGMTRKCKFLHIRVIELTVGQFE